MELDDVEPEIFGLLIHWLYTKNIHQLLTDDKHNLESTIALVKLWTLGKRFIIPTMQASVMVALEDKLVKATVFNELSLLIHLTNFIYENDEVALEHSALKQLVIRKFAHSTAEVLRVVIKGMPQEILFDIRVKMPRLPGVWDLVEMPLFASDFPSLHKYFNRSNNSSQTTRISWT